MTLGVGAFPRGPSASRLPVLVDARCGRRSIGHRSGRRSADRLGCPRRIDLPRPRYRSATWTAVWHLGLCVAAAAANGNGPSEWGGWATPWTRRVAVRVGRQHVHHNSTKGGPSTKGRGGHLAVRDRRLSEARLHRPLASVSMRGPPVTGKRAGTLPDAHCCSDD